MTETWKKWVLLAAGAWNVLGAGSALIHPDFSTFFTSSLDMNDPLQAFFYRGLWIDVIFWGVAYILAATTSGSRTAILLAGAGGKVVYFGTCVNLYLIGVGKGIFLAVSAVDLAFAALFAIMLFVHSESRPAVEPRAA